MSHPRLVDKADSRAKCWDCAYRKELPGSAHIECTRDFEGTNVSPPDLVRYGVTSGWCFFPFIYDPCWVGPCDGFDTEPKHRRSQADPAPYSWWMEMFYVK